MRVGGGGGYSFVACLRHSTIGHACPSRRSIVPTLGRYTFNIKMLIAFTPYTTCENKCVSYSLPVWPSVCGHLLPPKIAIVFSPCRPPYQFSPCHNRLLPQSPTLTRPCPPYAAHTLPLWESSGNACGNKEFSWRRKGVGMPSNNLFSHE